MTTGRPYKQHITSMLTDAERELLRVEAVVAVLRHDVTRDSLLHHLGWHAAAARRLSPEMVAEFGVECPGEMDRCMAAIRPLALTLDAQRACAAVAFLRWAVEPLKHWRSSRPTS